MKDLVIGIIIFTVTVGFVFLAMGLFFRYCARHPENCKGSDEYNGPYSAGSPH